MKIVRESSAKKEKRSGLFGRSQKEEKESKKKRPVEGETSPASNRKITLTDDKTKEETSLNLEEAAKKQEPEEGNSEEPAVENIEEAAEEATSEEAREEPQEQKQPKVVAPDFYPNGRPHLRMPAEVLPKKNRRDKRSLEERFVQMYFEEGWNECPAEELPDKAWLAVHAFRGYTPEDEPMSYLEIEKALYGIDPERYSDKVKLTIWKPLIVFILLNIVGFVAGSYVAAIAVSKSLALIGG